MAITEYKLSYTAAEINERLGNVEHISKNVGVLQSDVGVMQTDVDILQNDIQNKAEVMTLTTAEYEALEKAEATNANTLYMITDADDDVLITVEEIDEICGVTTTA